MAITGGVPKYLEEFSAYRTVDVAVRELCFKPTGFLFREFDSIFSDIFGKKSQVYAAVLRELTKQPYTPQHLAQAIDHPLNGDWSDMVFDLEVAGFIRRDFTWNLKGEGSRLSQLRVRDNYTKFYLNYIEPKRKVIEKLPPSSEGGITQIPWATVLGLQFENLILANIKTLLDLARIPVQEIIQIGPYFQTATKLKQGVQIDCLLQCKKGLLHIFEFKTGKKIGIEVANDLALKSSRLKLPRGFAMRHYLVYAGELSDALQDSDFFDQKISFEEFCI